MPGPDPSAAPADQLKQKDGEIVVPDEMRWMVDFDKAVEVGLGFRIDLDDIQSHRGFQRLLAVGIRLNSDEQKSQALIEELFKHHQYGRSGLSLLPQGTPTNNTEDDSSGFSHLDDPDAAFDDYFKSETADLFVKPDEWAKKRDGQWLAELLGIDREVLKKTAHADGTDQVEARAMNIALWPATLGYMMETMLHPVFDTRTVEKTRWFFNNYVSGRGAIPAIRIGKQPYGILPTTAFSRMNWLLSERFRPNAGVFTGPFIGMTELPDLSGFFRRLYGILRKMDEDWKGMAAGVSHVGKAGDAHQLLLDVVGLHPGSVEYYQRYSQSLEQLFNMFNLGGLGGALIAALIAAGYQQIGVQLLNKLGYTGEATPDIINKFFITSQNLLKGPVVDAGEFSETEKIKPSTTDGKNYIEWLIAASHSSLDTLRRQQGFKDDKAPGALLYLMLRHALILGYWDTSIRLHRDSGIEISPGVLREPSFIHVSEKAESSESRWSHLYKVDPRITTNQNQSVADFIPTIIKLRPAARYLNEQLEALELLKDTPTARLERAFADHIDSCSYRLDAWQLGLVNYQLAAMRYGRDGNDVVAKKGLYLGAFGWLEDVKPENKEFSSVDLTGDLDLEFNKPGDPPLMRDNTNGGYIHAPSLNHAVTAAVLRNGYISNAAPGNPQTLSVNLSSDRVRLALSILEGIRGGQSLGALLGYQFERGLHDRHNEAEVDQFIFRMRKAFPLRANRLLTTKVEKDEDGNEVSIEAIEARNVLDGVRLVEHVKKTGVKTFPFGIAKLNQPNAPTVAQAAAINAEVDRVLDVHDAVADLALAEGVHQAVQGNYDRVASTLDTYSKGNFPPEPDVVRTPRSGFTLTHRVGLNLEAGLAPGATPRAKAEPAVNKWLGSILPPAADVFCKVEYFDPIANAAAAHDVSLQDLQLQPIDLLYIVHSESLQAMDELSDRIVRHIIATFDPRPDAVMKISYLFKPAGKISIFELMPLAESLRSILLRSRPLRASDITLQTESGQEQDTSVFVDRQRIVLVKDGMKTLQTNMAAFNATAATVDASITSITDLLSEAGKYAIPQSGWGFAYSWKQAAFAGVLKKVDELLTRWVGRLADYDALIAQYTALLPAATDLEKFDILQRAESLITAAPTPQPLPAPDTFKTTVLDPQRISFVSRLDDFKLTILKTSTRSLTSLIASVKALSVTQFDLTGIDLEDNEKAIDVFAADLNSRAQSIAADLDKRIKSAEKLIVDHDNSTKPAERVQFMDTAAKTLLGDDFRIIPEFGISSEQADEWDKSLVASQSGELLKYLTDPPNEIDFPVDDWLYGVSRVREKMRHWEKCVMLSEAFKSGELRLEPVQLPFKPNDRWLALEYPADYKLDGDRLLFTAAYAAPFQKLQRQCGLLIDEWNEVIPGKDETTGIAFHYDRPNAEPPQTMLLVTPANMDGPWQWQDLVDAINETLEMAKKRAVEPVHVDQTAYARFLPSTVMAVTLYQISIAANLAVNNNIYHFIEQGNNG